MHMIVLSKHIQEYLLNLPYPVKFVIFAVSAIYFFHFYIFYIKKPEKKILIFWQLVVYMVLAIAGYCYFKKYHSGYYELLFLNKYSVRTKILIVYPVLRKVQYFVLCVPVVYIVRKYLLRFFVPQKELKHGPVFRPTDIDEDKGIVIGHFDRDVLPSHIREFIPVSRKALTIPYNRLSRGITIIGDMGCGKSRLMYMLHNGILKRYPHIPILIHDPKGEWLRTFYNPETDLIFAPFDKRSMSWSLWNDFKLHPELKHSVIATGVVSHHTGSNTDRFWSDSAIMLIKDAAAEDSLKAAKKALLLKRDCNMGDRTFQSILATARIGFRDIVTVELMNMLGVPCKTIDDILRHPGRIFLLNNPCCYSEQHGSLTLLLSAFLLQAISLPDVKEDELRAAVFIDEALTFHLPADVERAIYSQSRSKGLCIIASAQRLPDVYHGERGGWSSGAAHLLGMRVQDMPTRSSLSQRLGNMMYDEKQHSISKGKESTTKTLSEVQRQHAALAPEDFGSLQNREFVLFHETGVSPGKVVDVDLDQREEINTIEYVERNDVIHFMREL